MFIFYKTFFCNLNISVNIAKRQSGVIVGGLALNDPTVVSVSSIKVVGSDGKIDSNLLPKIEISPDVQNSLIYGGNYLNLNKFFDIELSVLVAHHTNLGALVDEIAC